MKLDIEEKKVLYVFGCDNHHNTVARLKYLTALTVDRESKHRILTLARKMDSEGVEKWYCCFYHRLRSEMEGYFRASQYMSMVERSTV